MLLKFFAHSDATAYLRGLAEEFNESTNAIRHELNNLSKAGFLVSREDGRTILYKANKDHPLFNEVRNLVHKYLGIDKIIENIVHRLGDIELAMIIGDYARGTDSGMVELVLVGTVDQQYLDKLTTKAQTMIKREIRVQVITPNYFELNRELYKHALLVWKKN